MSSITIPAEIATKLYDAINNNGYSDDIRIFPTGNNNRAFLGICVDKGGIVAIPVTIEGDFNNLGYVIVGGTRYFKIAASDRGNVSIEVDGRRARVLNYQDINVDTHGNVWAELNSYNNKFLVASLSNSCEELATIKLPKKLQKSQAILFDTANHRVGYYKYVNLIPDYSKKEILSLDVIHGQVVSAYNGELAYYLPWKKGLPANIVKFSDDSHLALRFENDGLICLQAALNPDVNADRYRQVFGEENVFGNEIWVEEDDDFLTTGAKK